MPPAGLSFRALACACLTWCAVDRASLYTYAVDTIGFTYALLERMPLPSVDHHPCIGPPLVHTHIPCIYAHARMH